MALHSLYCADVPLKTAHSLT